MPTITPDVYLSLGLTREEYDLICGLLGRDPSQTELGMFSVQWSEHCSYKCSKEVLASFKKYKEAVEGDGLENAGIVPIGDGLGIAMKVESHNHPSAVEPYQGAATGVGGIIRDIFTMGARPVACLNSLRFGPINGDGEVVQRNRYLFEHVVAGIAGYGNCVGVPTVAGEVAFHPRYSGNPLVNAMCVGLVKTEEVTTAGAAGLGNPVIYLGSSTGKDGIHGASFASEVLGEDSDAKRPNVQIGDPFAEKLLIEATLEALQTGAIQSIQDMGAAGLTCSTTEMSSKGGVGMEIDLDLVPMRDTSMSAYELMLSESQERMLCVAHQGREHEVIAVFKKWGLHAVVIGRVTGDGHVRVWRHGKVEVDAPSKAFTDACPTYRLPIEEPPYFRQATDFTLDDVPVADPEQALRTLLSAPSLASKRWVFQQYDQQVQTQTTLVSGAGDAAVLALRGTKRGVSLKIDGNARWVYFDPYVGGQLAVAEAARNVACTGARPRAITDGLNFGSPKQPHVYWQFERAVKGIADAAETLGTPVVSGNVSFYNESDLGEVLPTPLIGMMGVLEDAEARIGMDVAHPCDLFLLWYRSDAGRQQGLGASSYLAEVHGVEDGRPVAPSLGSEQTLCNILADWVEKGLIMAAHDVSEGGIAFALAEMLMSRGMGAEIDLPMDLGLGPRDDSWLFGELPGLVIVATNDPNTLKSADRQGLRLDRIGATTSAGKLTVSCGAKLLLEANVAGLAKCYNEGLTGFAAG
ncbi:MAG: phosphoribosylformylglycinamidine synthase subunit PurL [Armatimonadetes bacterium]|nr:phosphoribosylformylglycinamidine synthase subunit PurL [Armatimonadota bacterium]